MGFAATPDGMIYMFGGTNVSNTLETAGECSEPVFARCLIGDSRVCDGILAWSVPKCTGQKRTRWP